MLAVISFCLIGLTFASQQTNYFNLPEEQWTEPETPEVGFLGLSSGASLVVPNIRTGFSCVGRNYGYFADVENNCQIYHVCQPSRSATGEPVIYHFTQFCPNQTQFDQRLLGCLNLNHPNLLPCRQSLQYYPLTETRFRETPVIAQQRENLEQIPVSEIERSPEIVQRFEQVPVEQQREELLDTISTNPAPLLVRGSQTLVRRPIVLNREEATKNIGRSDLVQNLSLVNVGSPLLQPIVPLVRNVPNVQQSVLPLRNSQIIETVVEQPVVQNVLPQRNLPILQNTPQLISSQQVIPESGLVQPISVQSDSVLPVVPLRNVEQIRSVNPEVVSQTVETVLPPRDSRIAELRALGLTQIPLRNIESVQIGVNPNQPIVRQSGLVGPVVSLRNNQNLLNRPLVSQPVVTLRRSPLEQVVPQQIQYLNPILQSVVPLRSSQIVEEVDSRPLLTRYNVELSQLAGIPLQPVERQLVRTQSVVPQYSLPLIRSQVIRQVGQQNPISQPLLSSYKGGSGLIINRRVVPQNLVSRPLLLANQRNSGGIINPIVPQYVVKSSLRSGDNIVPNVIRPAQNPNFLIV